MSYISYIYEILPKYLSKLGVIDGFSLFFKIHIGEKKLISFKIPDYKYPIFIRKKTTDGACFSQMIILEEYSYNISFEPKVIIDLGANSGYSTLYFANKYKNSTIVALEPDNNNFKILSKNLEKYVNVHTINKGIWYKNAYLKIKNSSAASWSFQLEETTKDEGMESLTIKDILKKIDSKTIDILKIDIEGAENKLFSSNSDYWLKNTRFIFVETHDRYVPGTEKLILEKSKEYGFKVDKKGEYLVLEKK